MKLLAIRGKNLASLPAFNIELTRPPLLDAGLFAICGPTGSGKSTLLDALCVALFDKTPRLSRPGGVPIGHASQNEKDRLPANDVRGILRHGTGSGFAEVEFEGCDQRRYRARWEVRRARERPHGRLQNQVMTLEDLDRGELISDKKKTHTLQLIERRLGLDFDQFRRSVLLAQGEFTAFLRAGKADRGKLLERMTGTRIYSELSKAAFERQKLETAALASLKGDVADSALLGDDERDTLERHRGEVERELSALEQHIEHAEQAIAWHRRATELTRALQDAEHTHVERHAHWQTIEAQRVELRAIEAARIHAPTIRAVDQRLEATTQAQRTLERAIDTERVASDDAHKAATARERARNALATGRAEHERTQPLLQQADRLDTDIERAVEAAQALHDELQAARLRAQRTEDEHHRLCAHLDRDRDMRTTVRAWCAERDDVRELVREWPRWDSELERYERASDALATLNTGITELESRVRETCAERQRADEHCDQAVRARDNAQAAADTAQLEADAVPLDRIRSARDEMTARADGLHVLAGAVRDARMATDAKTRTTERAREARDQAEKARTERIAVSTAIDTLAHRLAEAEQTLERLGLSVQLGAHRSALVPGQPCPLCGACTHPDAHTPSPGQYILDDQRAHIVRLRQQRDDANERRAALHTRIQSSLTRADECDTERTAANAEHRRATDIWRAQIAQLGELALVDDPGSPQAAEAVDARLRATETELERLAARQRAAEALQDAARRAHSLAVSRESDLTMAIRHRNECIERERAAREALERQQLDIDRYQHDMATIVQAFTIGLGPYATPLVRRIVSEGVDTARPLTTALERDPRGFHDECTELVSAYTRKQRQEAEVTRAIDNAQAKLDTVVATLEEHRTRVQALERSSDEQTHVLDALNSQRAHVLDGRPTDRVRALLAAERERFERDVEHANRRAQAAAERAAVATAERGAADTALQRERIELSRARTTLDDELTRTGGDLDDIRARCRVSDEWVREERARIDEIEHALTQAHTVVVERREQFDNHQRTGRPPIALDDAEPAVAEGRERRRTMYAQRSDIEHKLRLDDAARKQRADMASRIAAQKKRAHVYQTLSELIGSHDGAKFRIFAQSLTLDALLAYANHHLRDLASRYQLVRVPQHHLELQIIDRDMGDDVRSINSLSGGESFLVSLALALGLSSLAARDTKVESLLIDEGFGSLDTSTLDVALSVLDALQATGRQVGLISHVPGLAERVGVCITVQPRGSGRSVIRVSER